LLKSFTFLLSLLMAFVLPIPSVVAQDRARDQPSAPPDTLPWLIMVSDELPEDMAAEEYDETAESMELPLEQFTCTSMSFDQYKSIWDTTTINPYRVNLRDKADTTMLRLITHTDHDYVHPTCGDVTSEFGMRGRRYHYGIDVDLETGDAVLSAFEGTVRIARYSPSYGYFVLVRHANGLETLYAHLSRILVKSGDKVQAGDLLGLGGNTGRSRGSHLHFEVRFLGQQVNPRDLIDFEQSFCHSTDFAITAKNFQYLKDADAKKAEIASRKYYKVRRGDTLGSIARKNGTTVKQLSKLNRISSRTKLKPGRKIRVA